MIDLPLNDLNSRNTLPFRGGTNSRRPPTQDVERFLSIFGSIQGENESFSDSMDLEMENIGIKESLFQERHFDAPYQFPSPIQPQSVLDDHEMYSFLIVAEQGVTPGWMMVFFFPENLSVIGLAARENQPMIWLPPTAMSDDKMETDRVVMTKIAGTESARRDLSALVQEAVASFQDAEYEDLVQSFPSHVRKIYTNYALTFVLDEGRLPSIESLLERKGLYDLLGRDGDLLTALVEISLAPPLNDKTQPIVRASLEEVGIDLDKSLQKLRDIQETTGIPLLLTDEDSTIWCLV